MNDAPDPSMTELLKDLSDLVLFCEIGLERLDFGGEDVILGRIFGQMLLCNLLYTLYRCWICVVEVVDRRHSVLSCQGERQQSV